MIIKKLTRAKCFFLLLAAGASFAPLHAHEAYSPNISRTFALDATCKGDTAYLSVEDTRRDLRIPLGTISRGEAQATEAAALLNEKALSALGHQLMTNQALQDQMSLCSAEMIPTVERVRVDNGSPSSAKPGASVCYPLEHCRWFDAACAFFGGKVINIPEGPMVSEAHHICLSGG